MDTTEKKKTGFQLKPENINRNGRPRDDKSWGGIMRRVGIMNKAHVTLTSKDGRVKEFYVEAKDGQTLKEACVIMQYARALQGDPKALNLIMERTEGKVAQEMKFLPPEQPQTAIDVSKLKPEELVQFKALLQKAKK